MTQLLMTPLHSEHIALKARMAPFAGYDMPISYDQVTGGMAKEHLAVRQNVGMFDVSHMGEFWIAGPDATQFLNHLCTRPFDKTPHHKAQYCLLLNDSGTIVDDIIVYKLDANLYWMVVNAANVSKDWKHLQSHKDNFNVTLTDVSAETALIAVQGPRAVHVVESLIPRAKDLKYYTFFQPSPNWIVARTGYTGEDGFEIFLPNSLAVELWNRLKEAGAIPIGLGARDTLRLEVGFPLYGHELDDSLKPLETFAAFAMDPNHTFVGASGAKQTPRYLPVSIQTDNPKPIRAGDKLFVAGQEVGWITSGSTSPIKKLGIGLGLVQAQAVGGSKPAIFMLESAGKQREARAQSLPFVPTARVKAKGTAT
jgi:aminomethyltransferase